MSTVINFKEFAILTTYGFISAICVAITNNLLTGGLLLISGLLFIEDLATMEVSIWKLWILGILTLIALHVQFSVWSVITMVVYTIGLLVLRKIYNGMLGGADIIYIACLTCIIGPVETIHAVCIGCTLTLIVQIKHINSKEPKLIPFLPGLCIGVLFQQILTEIFSLHIFF